IATNVTTRATWARREKTGYSCCRGGPVPMSQPPARGASSPSGGAAGEFSPTARAAMLATTLGSSSHLRPGTVSWVAGGLSAPPSLVSGLEVDPGGPAPNTTRTAPEYHRAVADPRPGDRA